MNLVWLLHECPASRIGPTLILEFDGEESRRWELRSSINKSRTWPLNGQVGRRGDRFMAEFEKS